jgi:hypothetical protein
MCDPFTVTALALTAAGTYAQYQGQRQAQKAMEGATLAEARRQQRLRDEAQGLFDESLGKQNLESQTERLADQVAERDAAMVGNQESGQVVNIPVQGGAPDIVADETAARVSEGNAAARQEASAKAALAAFGDLQLGNALMNARYGAQQSQLANFMGGSQNVLQTELQAASRRGDKTKLLGDVLVAGGQIAGMGAMANGGGLFGAKSAANPGGLQAVASGGLQTGSPGWFDALGVPMQGRYANPTILPR